VAVSSKSNADLLCATRYGIMMLRHARTPETYRNFHRKIEMPDLGIRLMRKFVTWHNLKNEAGNGSWAIFDGMVTVRTPDGTKSAQIGGMPPEYLARVLMRELFYEQQPDVA